MEATSSTHLRLGILRALSRAMPLGVRYYPIVRWMSGGEKGCISTCSLGYRIFTPVEWARNCMPLLVDGLEAAVCDFRLVEDHIVRLKGGQILDVGANMGWWSLLCARRSRLPIVAFEPDPRVFGVLAKNVASNRIASIHARNVACGSEDQAIAFHSGMNGYTLLPGFHDFSFTDDSVIQVPCSRIDSLPYVQDVAFMKVDVEGFEWHVLQGAAGLIERSRPALLVEIHPPQLADRGRSAIEVLGFLKSFYRNIRLYVPRQRSDSRLRNFLANYSRRGRFREVPHEEFDRMQGGANVPVQIYAFCTP
jgi:FkbM family methyltransferase